MSDATAAITALALKLSAVASVRVGRAALETTSATMPVITLWSTQDQPAADQGYGYAMQFTRTVMLEYKSSAADGFNEDLDAALSAIRLALKNELMDGSPLSGYAIALRQNGANFFAPADNGDIAIVQMTLEFDYLERF